MSGLLLWETRGRMSALRQCLDDIHSPPKLDNYSDWQNRSLLVLFVMGDAFVMCVHQLGCSCIGRDTYMYVCMCLCG